MRQLIVKSFNGIGGRYTLLDVRFAFHILAFIHLVLLAAVTLSIDTTVDSDPVVKQYGGSIRFKLITFWFNVLTLIYFPVCLYCEWQQRNGAGSRKHVQVLIYITDVLMTSILIPTTTLADVLFWSLMKTDVSLVAPPRLFEYLPVWCQHSLHTVSFIVMVLDLMLTPRRLPNSLLPRYALGTAFFTSYFLVLYISIKNEEFVYSFLELLTTTQHIMVMLASYAAYTTFFLAGWKFINYFWDGYTDVKKVR